MTGTEPEDRASTTPRGSPWEPVVRALERRRPPLPRFRSPLRGPWLTSVLGAVLLAALPVVILTGLLSYVAYGPQFGQAIPGDVGFLRLPQFDWPASPSWLYRLTQGLHVGLGLVLVPVVLAKLWSVAPKLFAWPPVRSPAQALERLSLLLLVGGILFEIVTGLLNIQYDYVFGFSFYAAHYVGAWVFSRLDGRGVRARLRGAAAHQTVSSRWLTASASPACAASHARGRGSRAHGTTSHTANGSQIRSTSALDSPVRSATTIAASAASASSAAAAGSARGAATARRAPAHTAGPTANDTAARFAHTK